MDEPTQALPSEDLSIVRARVSEPLDVSTFYANMAAHKAALGPSFRIFAELWTAPGEVLGALRLPSSWPDASPPSPTIHPVLLDSVFQALGALVPSGSDATFVPVGVNEIQLLAAPDEGGWCHVQLREDIPGESAIVDGSLRTREGQPWLVIRGLQYRCVERTTLLRTLNPLPRDWNYALQWAAPDSEPDPAGDLSGAWIVASPDAKSTDISDRSIVEAMELAGASIDRRRALDGDPPIDAAVAGLVVDWRSAALGDVAADGERICEAALQWTRRLTEMSAPPRMVWITRNAVAAEADDPLDGLAQSPLWAMARTIRSVHPSWSLQMIDVGDDVAPEGIVTAMRSSRPELALRANRELTCRLDRRGVPAPTQTPPLRSDASYLVTGGTGGIGRELVRWLAAHGAGEIVIVSRHAPASRELEDLVGSLAPGCLLRHRRADLADERSVMELLAELGRADKTLRGIFHVAGVLEDGRIESLPWERFRAALAPKLRGAWYLHRHGTDLPLDHFVLFSSTSAILGAPGQANYAAANGFLDALAAHRHQRGQAALSVAWGPWLDTGMAADRSLPAGIRGMDPGTALQMLEGLLSGDEPTPVVADIDWRTLGRQIPGDIPERLAGLMERAPRELSWLTTRLHPQPESQWPQLVTQRVSATISRVLELGPGRSIGARDRLFDHGADSLMAAELRTHLERDFDLNLRTTLLFDFPTLEALTTHLLTVIARPPAPRSDEARAETTATDVDSLSGDALVDVLAETLDHVETLHA